ncbi:MAG: Gfo/Idh/MocA family oxidoreductase [Anaerolineae bacterium]|nr:Gfo/Idh/MocA family oxidoreductase [Anaerolineae bacterium]
MDEKLRVGIIGAGFYAMSVHVPVLKMTGRAEIVAVCRRNEERLAMAQAQAGANEAYTDWREMLGKAEMDAVVICTPHNLHCEQTVAALEHGLHVLVEKPMALTAAEGWAMVDAARRADRVLMPAYAARLMQMPRAVKQALDQGLIGRVRQITTMHAAYFNWNFTSRVVPEDLQAMGLKFSGLPAEFFNNWQVDEDSWNWRGDPSQNGGGLFADGGAHLVDLALWFGGAPATEVVAFMDATAPEIERFVSVQARLANDVMVTISQSDVNGTVRGIISMTIVGDDGVLTGDYTGIWLQTAAGREEIKPEWPDLYPAMPFVSCILDGTPNPIPGVAGAYAAAMSEAAYLSAAERRIVSLATPS